jgi:hypothetical protein
MTENVTELFQRYRQCLREIWNAHFWQHSELRNWDSVTVFERLKPCIFRALVLESLAEGCCIQSPPVGTFLVVPNIPDNSGDRLATHVVVTKREGAGRSWVEEILALRASDAALRFVDVFDWSMMGYVDFRYYVAEISGFTARPELNGAEVLIDVYQADVFRSSVTEVGKGPDPDRGLM